MTEDKKDLTSLVELSALELANNPPPPGGDPSMQLPEIPSVTEADFGDLDELSKKAIAENPNAGPLPENEIPPIDFTVDGAPMINMTDTEPGSAPADASPAPLDVTAPPELAGEMSSVDVLPSDTNISTGVGHADPIGLPPLTEAVTEPATVTATAPMTGAQNFAPLDPARPAVNEPPAGASHAKKSPTPGPNKHDFDDVKKFGEKIAIGRPSVEGSPAFSLMVKSPTGEFSAKTIKAIEDAVASEDFGIRLEDVQIQLTSGKLLVPQISEFAAITLAQKLRDVVDSIEVDLAAEIYRSSAADLSAPDDSFLVDTEHFEQHREEVHDIGAEPRNENDVFSSNLGEISEFQVTRILSAITASAIIPAEVAENPSSKEFELMTERLTKELIARAFKLGAHGVLGISFTLRSIDGYKDESGKVRRAYRVLGSGTAVRARRK